MSGAPIHVVLLTGPDGVGKRTLSYRLAQMLHCFARARPCGECPACQRFLSGSHPDAHRIEAKKSIGVDEIRGLISSLTVAPYEGGYRTVVIECAGAMTVQAQNCLLKTLEEPLPRTVFFLTATSATQLLPTIRSRCSLVRVPPFSNAQVEAALKTHGLDEERSVRLAALASGSLGLSFAMEEDETFWPLWEKVQQSMAEVSDPSRFWVAMERLKDEKNASSRVLDLIEHTLQMALRSALMEDMQRPEGAWGEKLIRANARALTHLLGLVAQVRRMLASNVSWQAALERFLLEYSEESKLWQS